MVGVFNGSEWVSDSEGCIIPRGVTSCASMTVFFAPKPIEHEALPVTYSLVCEEDLQ